MAWHVGGKTSVFANGVAGLHAVDMLLIEAGGVIDKADGGTAGMVDLHPQTVPTWSCRQHQPKVDMCNNRTTFPLPGAMGNPLQSAREFYVYPPCCQIGRVGRHHCTFVDFGQAGTLY